MILCEPMAIWMCKDFTPRVQALSPQVLNYTLHDRQKPSCVMQYFSMFYVKIHVRFGTEISNAYAS